MEGGVHGHLRIDVNEDTQLVILSIVEDHNYGGVEIRSIAIDYRTARTFAHYVLEHCSTESEQSE